jgi:hypothetical protein
MVSALMKLGLVGDRADVGRADGEFNRGHTDCELLMEHPSGKVQGAAS